MFWAVKLTRINKYSFSGYGISFDVHWDISLSNCGFGNNVIIFCADMSLSVHVDNKNEYIS